MSMEQKVVAWGRVTFDAEGGVVASRLYNCSVADVGAGVGDFNVTIGNGGVDRQLCQIKLRASSATAVGANGTTSHTSDTVKRIQFRDAAGTLAAPTVAAYFEICKMPPLPTP